MEQSILEVISICFDVSKSNQKVVYARIPNLPATTYSEG